VNTLPAKTPHKFFSIARVWAISSNTLLELVRLKVFYFLLIFALLIIGSAGFTEVLDLGFQEQFQILKDVSLGAMSIFTILLGTLATANMLPKDIEDRTLYTILAKPVPRFEYLIGKLLGMFLLLLISTLLMSLMFVAALAAKQHFVTEATIQQYAGRTNTLAYTLTDLKAHTFTMSLIPCVVTIYLKAILLATLTMMISTFSSSYIFTLFISFTCYFIGSIEATARDYLFTPTTGEGMRIFIQLVTLVFPDLQLFNLVDDIVAGNTIALALFVKTAGLGLTYVFVYSLVAYVIFSFKEL
jgi:ABC-type transport system involved in multi-copper enzyme maturation permease subunit